MARRVIPGNARTILALIFPPDAQSTALASSMAIANNTLSPMAAGVHSSGTTRGFSGLGGFGVNRATGRTDPQQLWAGAAGAVQPVQTPKSRRLGAGAMPSGQPGLPSTGQNASGIADLGGDMPAGWSF
ncbi:MAG TPA: hypothetical protein VHA75_21290 [Rugosimonospora sp.]|nr:hypothetical protein [Rugosimonospora sp.]